MADRTDEGAETAAETAVQGCQWPRARPLCRSLCQDCRTQSADAGEPS